MKLTQRLLIAALLSLTASAGWAGQSAGATATPPAVKTCFRYADNGAVVTNGPVTLYEAAPTASKWTKVRTGTTNSTGCVTFTGMHRGYWYYGSLYRVFGDSNVGLAILSGETNGLKTGSTGTLSLSGRVIVQCIPGLYGSIC
jgi:hypothetical protein